MFYVFYTSIGTANYSMFLPDNENDSNLFNFDHFVILIKSKVINHTTGNKRKKWIVSIVSVLT